MLQVGDAAEINRGLLGAEAAGKVTANSDVIDVSQQRADVVDVACDDLKRRPIASLLNTSVPGKNHPFVHHDTDDASSFGDASDLSVTDLAVVRHESAAIPMAHEDRAAWLNGDGTLLDRSLIYYGSGMGNGNTHDRNDPPAVVASGANGRL